MTFRVNQRVILNQTVIVEAADEETAKEKAGDVVENALASEAVRKLCFSPDARVTHSVVSEVETTGIDEEG